MNAPPKGPIDDPEDENALWVQLTKDVRPLKRQKSLDSEPSKPKPARTKKKKHVHHTPQTPPNIRKPQNTQLDKRTDERLRKGQIPIEAHLDLHGFNQEQAHSAVNRFVQSAYHAHKRCVLIITGKHDSVTGCDEAADLAQTYPRATYAVLDRAGHAAQDYLALGDWHGTRRIDARTWYSGTPEHDRF